MPPAAAAPPPAAAAPAFDGMNRQPVEDCLAEDTCIPVNILFGTNRDVVFGQPVESFNRFQATPETPFKMTDAEALTLGELLITVPKERALAEISRPSRFRIPWTDITIGGRLNPERHFVFVDYARLSEDQFGARLEEIPTAFIFVHGFNVPMKSAAMRAAQLKVDSGFEGQAMIYSWPTQQASFSNFGAAAYQQSRSFAEAARTQFRDFIGLVMDHTDAGAVHIVAHSMGNYVMMDVLADLNDARPAGSPPQFGEIVFAAPDVGQDRFVALAERMEGLGRGMTLYASSKDIAMTLSRKLCETQGGADCPPRAGDVPERGPLVVGPVETVDVSSLDEGFFSFDFLSDFGHSYYGGDRSLLQDIGLMLQTGLRPPKRRNPTLREEGREPNVYWVYP